MDVDKELDEVVRDAARLARLRAGQARHRLNYTTPGEARDALADFVDAFERFPSAFAVLGELVNATVDGVNDLIASIFPGPPKPIPQPTLRDRVRGFIAPMERPDH